MVVVAVVVIFYQAQQLAPRLAVAGSRLDDVSRCMTMLYIHFGHVQKPVMLRTYMYVCIVYICARQTEH